MTKQKSTEIVANDPLDRKGELKRVGGSTSDAFNNILANSVIQALWIKNSDAEAQSKQFTAAVAALTGIAPQDELEGMLAGQLIVANAAAMECYRRAMHNEQTFEGRKENLTQANKLSRTYVTLLEALNRHRGKAASKRSGSSMSTSMLAVRPWSVPSRPGVGHRAKMRSNPMQNRLPMHLSPRCGARTRSRNPCRSPAMPNGRCRMHGGASPGAPRGERNGNYLHGRFTCEALEMRSALNGVVRAARQIVREIV